MLIEALDDASAIIRWRAAQALRRHPDKQTLVKLKAELLEGDPASQAGVLDALGHVASEQDARDGLDLQPFLHAEAPSVRQAAARAAGRLKAKACFRDLIDMAKDEGNELALRRTALTSLSQMSLSAAKIGDDLVSLFGDPRAPIRAETARTVGCLKLTELVADLERALDDESPQVRRQAAWALGRVGTKNNLERLSQLRRDGHRVGGLRVGVLARRAARQIRLRQVRLKFTAWFDRVFPEDPALLEKDDEGAQDDADSA
jgi:HEAT repeat protein